MRTRHVADRSSRTRRIRATLALASLLVGGLPIAQPARAASESEVKSVLLLSFAQLSKWDESDHTADTFDVCVFRDADFGRTLGEATRGERAAGRPLASRIVESVTAADRCRILFVPKAFATRYREDADRAGPPSALIIGETPDFARRYGAVYMFLSGSKIGFQINRAAASRSGARISSRILSRAELVEDPADG